MSWKDVRNNYVNEDEGKVYIDAWTTNKGEEEGKVIAKIDIKSKEIEYLNEKAKTDTYAQSIIKSTIQDIENGKYKN